MCVIKIVFLLHENEKVSLLSMKLGQGGSLRGWVIKRGGGLKYTPAPTCFWGTINRALFVCQYYLVCVPLDEVRKGWIPKKYPHQVMTMASYYDIYDHMFDGTTFMPWVVMDIDYGDNVGVHYGNFIEPAKVNISSCVCKNFAKILII